MEGPEIPTLEYFKALSQEMSIPCQTLIHLYLRECAASQKHLRLPWEAPRGAKPAELEVIRDCHLLTPAGHFAGLGPAFTLAYAVTLNASAPCAGAESH